MTEVKEDGVTDQPMQVGVYSQAVPVSDQVLEELARQRNTVLESLNRWAKATPAERARWAEEAREERRSSRAAAPLVPLTLDALTERMGWTREYAEHLAQPYCTCGDDIDGWTPCQHAKDLGLDR